MHHMLYMFHVCVHHIGIEALTYNMHTRPHTLAHVSSIVIIIYIIHQLACIVCCSYRQHIVLHYIKCT